jgi:hypothetical protein
MKIRFERSRSLAAGWSRRLGLFALALFVLTAVLHRFDFLDDLTFAATFALSGAIALLALLLAVVGIYRLWSVGAVGGKAALKGLIMSLIVLVPTALVLYRGVTLPRIYDIATDTENPPRFLVPVSFESQWHIAPFMDPDAPYSGQAEAYPRGTGRRYAGGVDRVLEAVRLVAGEQGLRITQTLAPQQEEPEAAETDGNDEQTGEAKAPADDATTDDESAIIEFRSPGMMTDATRELVLGPVDIGLLEEGVIGPTAEVIVQAEFRTLVWGMESDISIRLIEEIETTYVDMRSVSRFGPHDFGIDAEIISRFLTALDAELLGISVR